MADVGRPSELSDELKLKIRDLILDGKNLKEVAETLEIPYATMRYWSATNYQSFSDCLLTYKHERKLQLAELVSDEILTMDVMYDGKVDTGILAVKQRESALVRESLDKKHYSKRTESTGKEGNPIEHNITGNVIVLKSFKDGADSQ